MPVRSLGSPHRSGPSPQLAETPELRSALSWFSKNLAWINDQQVRITEIPAPPFHEAARGAYLAKLLDRMPV